MIPIIVIADLHFGNLKVPTELLIERLDKYFLPKLQNQQVMLIIPGDVFHSSLSLTNTDSHAVISWIINLFDHLEQHKSYLRLIRGTYSHDRNQLSLFKKLYSNNKYTFSFNYYEKIEYENFPEFDDLKFLYIPDDIPFKTTSDVLDHIKEVLANFNTPQIDYIFGHGAFKHTFPPGLLSYPKILFEKEHFQNIVKRYCIFGHIHMPSTNGNIIYTGSFDCLNHGENTKKGFLYINNHKIKFIQNQEATIFKDFELDDTSELFSHLDKFIKANFTTKTIEYIRCLNVDPDLRHAIKRYITKHYPKLQVSFHKTSTKTVKNIPLLTDEVELQIPNKTNLSTFIREEALKHNYNLSIKDIESYIIEDSS